MGLTGPAKADYRRALDLDPTLVEAVTNLGALLEVGGNHADAIRIVKRGRFKLEDTEGRRKGRALADYCRKALSTPPVNASGDPPLFAPNRITAREIADAMQVARNKFPMRTVIVLHDGIVASNELHIDCRQQGLDSFSELDSPTPCSCMPAPGTSMALLSFRS